MLKIKEIYTKEEIQFTYDFIGYWLRTNFSAISLNSENNFNEENEHLQPWFSRDLINPIKQMVNGYFPENDFKYLVSEREKLEHLDKDEINKEFDYVKFGVLLFHMAQTIHNFNQENKLIPNSTRTTFINSQNLCQTFNTDSDNFAERLKHLKNTNQLEQQLEILRKLKDENLHLRDRGTAFLSLLKQNQKHKETESSEDVKQAIQKMKATFNFQSVTIHPGQSKNIIKDITEYSNTLKSIANKVGIPYNAIGMGLLNVSFHLTGDDFNLSFANTKVSAMHYVNLQLCGIYLKKKEEESFIHEYAHFISSLIFFGSKLRDVDDFNKYHKYSNDSQYDVKAMAPAHSLMLDWTAKTLINDNWRTLQKIKATKSEDAGLKFLEQGIANIILKGKQPINEEFLNSKPVEISPNDFSYKEYVKKIIQKMVKCNLLESSNVDANINDISIFFINHSSYGTFNHEIENEYMKTMLTVSLVDQHTYYLANPEEIWARCFEKLLKTNEHINTPMPTFNENNKFIEYLDAFEKIEVHPNSVDRLHMLKIVERVYDEIIPNHGFKAENSPCISEFKKNNPNEDDKSLEISLKILKNGLEYKGEKMDFSAPSSYKLSK